MKIIPKNISKFNSLSRSAVRLSIVTVLCFSFVGFVSTNDAQELTSCNRPDFNRSVDTGIYIWQACLSKQWFLRVSAGGLPLGTELRVIGNLKLSKPIVAIAPFSLSPNDLLDSSNSENIEFNFRVFIEAQDGFDFELENGTIACLELSSSIDAPIIIGGQNNVVTSPINIGTVDKTLCIAPLLVPSISNLLLEDNL